MRERERTMLPGKSSKKKRKNGERERERERERGEKKQAERRTFLNGRGKAL